LVIQKIHQLIKAKDQVPYEKYTKVHQNWLLLSKIYGRLRGTILYQ